MLDGVFLQLAPPQDAVAHHGDQRRSTGADQYHYRCFPASKLVFVTMICAADRWCRVSISDLERHQLTLLRTELELDLPANPNHRKTNQHKDIAA